jgi:general secretion pathway protein A
MYWETLGFTEPPFSLTPNPEFLFMSGRHQEAFAHLLFAIDNAAGFIELSGEVGTGKTTVIRTLLGQLDPARYRTAFIFNPSISPLGLLQEINREFGITSAGSEAHELHKTLNEFLLQENREGRTVVLVIDESQDLLPDVLEQVRLTSNLETEQKKLIQIVLVGQPELNQLLARQELRQLNQRITVRYHLEPMDPEEVNAYIRHRVRVAAQGREPVTFSDGALKRISRHSGGVPRLINAVCDRTLLSAYTREVREISPDMATEAIDDLVKESPRSRFTIRAGIIAATVISVLIIIFAVSTRNDSSKATVKTGAELSGATGVKVLQELLRQSGHYPGEPDGVFNERTMAAVKSFQKAEGLTIDGSPGAKTLQRLYQRSGGVFPATEPAPAPLRKKK